MRLAELMVNKFVNISCCCHTTYQLLDIKIQVIPRCCL